MQPTGHHLQDTKRGARATAPAAAAACVACLAAAVLPAHADELDTFQFIVGQSVQHDSNVFRLSDQANTQAVLGRPDRSDVIAVTTLGFKIDKPYGLQRLEFQADAQDYRYKNYSNLDFTAVNYAAAWRWSLTPRLHGNLTTDRREYVDTTADVQGVGQLNRRIERASLADAEFELGAAWRLLGGVFERSSSNSQPFTFENDTRVSGGEAGVGYVLPSGTTLAWRYRQGDGEYPGRGGRPVSSAFAGNFTDREHEVRMDWAATGKTTLRARLAHLDRRHESLPARDFSGLRGQLDASWAVTGKTSLTGGVVRELENYQTTNASYYEGYRYFVSPVWKPTFKTAVRLRYDHGVRRFKGPLPGFAPTARRDTQDLLSLGLEWEPVRAIKLVASMQRDRRKSTEPGFDYSATVFGLSALATF